ncbi:hypothetical protein G0Q06_12080 [Puniceicoccales bacterium CK1056]|uniref:TonB-dependent receptor plug domain-containing protein n=1 Tax=Oceanipulchritudo coccoides TaxID=2706888 RepID=A0A6B2M523_9BACT|nr:TonB-dependent receptor plug domain-containing protein [Oceanipulchritudo coccoides]NDV63194.1 hypothetical protein [Oceanipulchritudo coccoides]
MKLQKYLIPILLPITPLLAQTDEEESDSQVFELSPFVVDAQDDTGYYASQTLAGTRLKTDVRDVGSSIQILTSEFIDDVGADDVNDLFLYTTNTESSGLNGNFADYTVGATSFGDEAFRANPQGAQRIRGLTRADNTRNYFLTRIPSDQFNTERVEINRGANSILFGLGSPAGIANTSLSQARFSDFGEIRHRFDSEGTSRFELDYNKEVIKDKLAVRLALLADQTKFYQEPAFEDDDRVYLSAIAKPWKGAALRGFIESGDRDANRPSIIFPASTLETWFDSNPIVRQRVQDILDTNGVTDINGNPLTVPSNMAIAFDPFLYDIYARNETKVLNAGDVNLDGTIDAADDLARIHSLRNQVVFPQNNADRFVKHPNASRQILDVFNYNQIDKGGAAGGVSAIQTNINTKFWLPKVATLPFEIDPSGNGQTSYNYNASIMPWREWDATLVPTSISNLDIFDYTKNLLSGNSSFQNDDWKHYNITFEQLLLNDHFGFEVVYDNQDYSREVFIPFQAWTAVFVDVMENYLGQPNPNFGRPFIQARTNKVDIEDSRDTIRITSFLRVVPEEIWGDSRLASWLGKHTFTGLYNNYDQDDSRSTYNQYITDEFAGSTIRANEVENLTSAQRRYNYMFYLSDQDLTQLNSVDEVRLNRLTYQNIWNPGQTTTITGLDPVTGERYTEELQYNVLMDGYDTNAQSVDSYAAIWNGSFFNHHLIGLAGWRRDEARSVSYDAALDPITGLPDLDMMNLIGSDKEVTTESVSWSVVGHVPDRFMPEGTGLSLHYGVSENFTLGASQRDLYGNDVPAPSGETKEYGFTLELFDGKLFARVNWFETDLLNRALENNNNLYTKFITRGMLHIYGHLSESQVRGFIPPSGDPDSTDYDPGTPNFDLGMQALSDLSALIPQEVLEQANLVDFDGTGRVTDNSNPANTLLFGDTEDVTAEGLEVEVTYNPTRNWRISLNVAKQETVVTNYSPRLAALLEQTDSIIGSANGSIKDLRFYPDYDNEPLAYMTGEFTDNNDIGEWLEKLVYSDYRNFKSQEGRISDQQRKWRVNLITNYNFRDGFLDGFSIGGAYRWQDGAVVGYPAELINGQIISDVSSPHKAPSETNVDVWLRYRRKLFNKKVDWTIELRVQNINTDADDLIAVAASRNTDYEVAVWRPGPPRIWRITNTFKF